MRLDGATLQAASVRQELQLTSEMVEAGAKAIGLYYDDGGPRHLLRRAAEEAYVCMRAIALQNSQLGGDVPGLGCD